MQKKKIQIYIRQELFDHLVYPISIKLDDNLIILLFRKLHVISEIDFKISLKEWIQRAKECGLSESEASILFQTFKVFDTENNEYTSSSVNSRYEISNCKNSVDVRYFGLFFALQAFAQRAKMSLNIDKGDKSPFNYYTSPLSSPRGKSSNSYRNQNQGLEYQFIVSFIKTNLKLFLRIIASDIHNTETTLNANECNTLKFLFKIFDEDGVAASMTSSTQGKKGGIAAYASFFDNLSSVEKINMNVVSEWLIANIATTPPEQSDYINIKHLTKSVTIKTDDVTNKNIKISQCSDSYIYINTNITNCKIAHCENCTIVISAVSKIISIDKCDRCNVCVIANFVRVSNMIDSNIYLYSPYEPVLFGDNRGLGLGPHNVWYSDLYGILKSTKISITHKGLNSFSRPMFFNEKKDVNIIQPKDFNTITVPFDSSDFGYKLTPKNYIEAIEAKMKNYLKIKNQIKEAGLTEEQERAFHMALQGYYREWLCTSGNYKAMNDIVRMINPVDKDDYDDEGNNYTNNESDS